MRAALCAHYFRCCADGRPCLLSDTMRLRLREAIECLKRALIGADPQETVIHQKLAKLHNDLLDYAEAAAYHRRIVEVCRAARTCLPVLPPFFPVLSSPRTTTLCPPFTEDAVYSSFLRRPSCPSRAPRSPPNRR